MLKKFTGKFEIGSALITSAVMVIFCFVAGLLTRQLFSEAPVYQNGITLGLVLAAAGTVLSQLGMIAASHLFTRIGIAALLAGGVIETVLIAMAVL